MRALNRFSNVCNGRKSVAKQSADQFIAMIKFCLPTVLGIREQNEKF